MERHESTCPVSGLVGDPRATGGVPVQNIGRHGHESLKALQRQGYDNRLEQRIDPSLLPSGARFAATVPPRSSAGIGQPGLPGRVWGCDGALGRVERRLPPRALIPERAVMYSDARRLGSGSWRACRGIFGPFDRGEPRTGKGMVLNPEDHDTWSAGSFFTNPILPEAVAAALPRGTSFPGGEGLVKDQCSRSLTRAAPGTHLLLSKAAARLRASCVDQTHYDIARSSQSIVDMEVYDYVCGA